MYMNFETENNNYKCKLSTRSLVDIERELHDNPINIVGEMTQNKLPEINKLCCILFNAIKDFNHGIKRDEVYEIVDDYFATGHSLMDLLEFVLNLLEASGCLGKSEEPVEEEERKN